MDDLGIALRVGLVTIVVLTVVGWVWGVVILAIGLVALAVAGLGALVLRLMR